MAPLFAEPIIAFLLYYVILGAMHLWDNRDKRRVEVLNKKLRKMVAELKVVCAQPSPMTTSPSVAAIVSAVHALAYHIQHLTLFGDTVVAFLRDKLTLPGLKLLELSNGHDHDHRNDRHHAEPGPAEVERGGHADPCRTADG